MNDAVEKLIVGKVNGIFITCGIPVIPGDEFHNRQSYRAGKINIKRWFFTEPDWLGKFEGIFKTDNIHNFVLLGWPANIAVCT